VVGGGGKPRDKELKQLSQQLVDLTHPLGYHLEFLRKRLPGEDSAIWTKTFKDIFSLIAFMQRNIQNLRKDNVIRNIGGQSAVIINNKRKAGEAVMGETAEEEIKKWAKTRSALKTYRLQLPFQRGGRPYGRGRASPKIYSSNNNSFRNRYRGRGRFKDTSRGRGKTD